MNKDQVEGHVQEAEGRVQHVVGDAKKLVMNATHKL